MIYVERNIRGRLDDVWERTQTSQMHQRWDLRFSGIEYLPPSDGGVQCFRYSTRLGFGITVSGWGESVGKRLEDGKRTSALKFGSDQAISLIKEGSGYWQYEQVGDLVRFHTVYDYRVRFGAAGQLFDGLLFRPMICWATALSFDRLGLWIERGLDPEATLRTWIIHRICAFTLAFVWAYHGLAPKLLTHQPGEAAPLLEWGLQPRAAYAFVSAGGIAEILLAFGFLIWARKTWPWIVTIVAMPLLAIGALLHAPQRALELFNPVTFNLAVACVAIVGLLALKDAPSASHCPHSHRWKPK